MLVIALSDRTHFCPFACILLLPGPYFSSTWPGGPAHTVQILGDGFDLRLLASHWTHISSGY